MDDELTRVLKSFAEEDRVRSELANEKAAFRVRFKAEQERVASELHKRLALGDDVTIAFDETPLI